MGLLDDGDEGRGMRTFLSINEKLTFNSQLRAFKDPSKSQHGKKPPYQLFLDAEEGLTLFTMLRREHIFYVSDTWMTNTSMTA